AFPTLSDAFQCPIPVEAGCFRGSSLSRFPFLRFQLYQTLFRSVSGPKLISGGLWSGLAFRRIRLYQKSVGRMNDLQFEIKRISGSTGYMSFPV
ncbi:hypothetical protein ACFW6X_04975, partial [Streptomyces bacillaris]|uniref:hypothetical protein n=2 Tax=Streptomyces bacillaris TaxID=68179 RepID=UPI0036B8352A